METRVSSGAGSQPMRPPLRSTDSNKTILRLAARRSRSHFDGCSLDGSRDFGLATGQLFDVGLFPVERIDLLSNNQRVLPVHFLDAIHGALLAVGAHALGAAHGVANRSSERFRLALALGQRRRIRQ